MSDGRFVAYDDAARLAAFEARYERDPVSGCWIWKGATRAAARYPLFWDGKRKVGGHRWAYETFCGPILPGLTIDHLCRTPSCVNPLHLEPVTVRENTMRGTSFAPANLAKSSCPKGHPYSGSNLKVGSAGGRSCRRCLYDRSIAYAKRNRARLTERERHRRARNQ